MSRFNGDPDWIQAKFSDLDGWASDDHEAALTCFLVSARSLVAGLPAGRKAVVPPPSLVRTAQKLVNSADNIKGHKAARDFLESCFRPYKYRAGAGFVTGYFEPEVEASRVKTREFSYPLYSRPDDLVRIDENNRPSGFPATLDHARKTSQGLVEYHDRARIEAGALDHLGLELFWLRSQVEGFYIHVQGSARLALDDGSTVRVSYAGKTGHPYTSIGKVLVGRGVFQLEEANMKNMREWMENNPAEARKLMHLNRSFIFFREVEGTNPEFGPVAAAGVQLTPGRSIAVDRNIHAYGLPIWIATKRPLPQDNKPFRRLMIAQDTGSAIVGPERGDIFVGSGAEAGSVAGAIRHKSEFVVLWPAED